MDIGNFDVSKYHCWKKLRYKANSVWYSFLFWKKCDILGNLYAGQSRANPRYR